MIISSSIEKINKRIVGRMGNREYVLLPKGWCKQGDQLLVIEQDDNTVILTKNKTVKME